MSYADQKVLVTGATGFVGSAVLRRLSEMAGISAVGTFRAGGAGGDSRVEWRQADITNDAGWADALPGVDVVIHTAARVHVMHDTSSDPLADFRRVNVDGTLRLARHAVAAGVRRFIFISSIKVNGEQTAPGRPFTADDEPSPVDPYGQSKLEAERALRDLASRTGLEVVVIRPPLVYGAGVKANFALMMKMLSTGLWLPFAAIDNRRSMVALENLVDFIVQCAVHPASAGQTFLVSDGDDLSTPELLRRLGAAMGSPTRLVPVPRQALILLARLVGKSDVAKRLCNSLQVDIGKNRDVLGWVPPVSVDIAFQNAARR